MGNTQQRTSVCLWLHFLMDRFSLQANLGSTWQLTSILGHFWPMRVPVRLNFAKVCLNFSAAVCSWLVSRGIFRCRNDLGCFSFSFQHRIRQESEMQGIHWIRSVFLQRQKKETVQHLVTHVFWSKVMARRCDGRGLPAAILIGLMHFIYSPIW